MQANKHYRTVEDYEDFPSEPEYPELGLERTEFQSSEGNARCIVWENNQFASGFWISAENPVEVKR